MSPLSLQQNSHYRDNSIVIEMYIGKLKFICEGLMGQIVGLKSFISDRSGIESIWFKDINHLRFEIEICNFHSTSSYLSPLVDKLV